MQDINAFVDSFQVSAARDAELKGLPRRSYILDAFRRTKGSSEYTLVYNGETLHNNAGFNALEAVDGGNTFSHNTNKDRGIYKNVIIDDEHYFIASCEFESNDEAFCISLVRNTTSVMDGISALIVRCVIGSLFVTLITAAVMWFIVYHSLKPIGKLKAGAHELAGGHYEKRIQLTGKDELSELADDFNQMAGAIEENIGALHEKSERQQAFINDLSHELKTPVTSILLSAETLLNRKVSPEAMTHSLERIYDQGKWLERLSGKLMMLVMLQSKITMREESVAELLFAVKNTIADALAEQSMALKIDCTINTLPMDFDLMRSALVNLVENARKASGSGGSIEIHAHDNHIEVSDHGKGIPPEEISRITEPFYMVDRSRNKENGGSGLGLALVKRITEAHGAEFSVHSVLGEGTTMRITFSPSK